MQKYFPMFMKAAATALSALFAAHVLPSGSPAETIAFIAAAELGAFGYNVTMGKAAS